MDIFSILAMAKESKASDLHLLAYSPPLLRIFGSMQPVETAPELSPADTEQAFNHLTTEAQKAEFAKKLELDFGYDAPGIGRVRCNAARQRGTVSMVLRLLPSIIPTLEDLGLPDICRKLIMKRRGLIVITGPTGSGKSTTLAAMIDYLNKTDNRRLITIEDPIEYVYQSKRCAITQRELGSDTLTFAEALRHVLRQDPDIILVGEIRDMETAAAALTVAETGHLVLTTGHAPNATQAIERIMDLFPPSERHLAQTQLSGLLVGVLSQLLVPTADGNGRAAAIEIMLANNAVRNLIRDGKIYQIPNTIRMNTQAGMKLMDQALLELYKEGTIDTDNLFSFCNDPAEISKVIGHTEDLNPTMPDTTYYNTMS